MQLSLSLMPQELLFHSFFQSELKILTQVMTYVKLAKKQGKQDE